MRKKIELSFDPNGIIDGKLGCYRVCLQECRGAHAAGATPAGAVGDLFITHPKRFGKRMHVTAHHDLRKFEPIDGFLPEGMTALGKLVLAHPDIFGVEIVICDADTWPISTKRAPIDIFIDV